MPIKIEPATKNTTKPLSTLWNISIDGPSFIPADTKTKTIMINEPIIAGPSKPTSKRPLRFNLGLRIAPRLNCGGANAPESVAAAC